MVNSRTLELTSHVGRDLLQSAQLFRTDAAVVWEYVVNSLQYVDPGIIPTVDVYINPKKHQISIADNGTGMTEGSLEHFFTMHGENRERIAGRPGRGKFGTGKSAGFGIGRLLTVDTIRGGIRNTVSLSKQQLETSDGSNVRLSWSTRNEKTEDPNGTTITISDIFIKKIDSASVISYIERHLGYFRGRSPEVAVNNHVCESREPVISEERHFNPDESQRSVLGNISL